jgi:hypothetical protein
MFYQPARTDDRTLLEKELHAGRWCPEDVGRKGPDLQKTNMFSRIDI